MQGRLSRLAFIFKLPDRETAMPWIEPVTLAGDIARLEPLSHAHGADLSDAVEDGQLYDLWYTMVPRPEGVAAEIDRRLGLQAARSMLPFAVIDASSGKAVGMTTYMNIDGANRRLEIGSTWYRKNVQRSGINTACKLMLLRHAFEKLNCIAVEFRTHFFNQQSRRGIERLGAKLDGVLRNHMISTDGTLRDSCVYSIIESEWPTVKSHLNYQMRKPR